ncbi:g12784 [Coccomyxa viridis]|uniref:G12784 protein n=1 Tax=Coccomyxa viridis TaxID=1274662 RepID=A0ABP1GFJ0_9CHLO
MSSPDAFFDSGKAPGVEVWRIEEFKPVKQPAQSLGKFYTGDSYVILNTTKLGGDKLSHEIFYWQGKESTQDETGASAILAEQLDASMGGRPQEHREVQGEESSAFQSLFKGGIRYQSGGAASGFHHHEDAPHKATLAQIKGVRVTEVPLSLESLNSGDVFILDLGPKILVWAGSAATGMEKNKALTYTIALRDDRDHKGTAQVVHLEEDDKEGEDAGAFYSALGVDNPSSVSIKAAAS